MSRVKRAGTQGSLCTCTSVIHVVIAEVYRSADAFQLHYQPELNIQKPEEKLLGTRLLCPDLVEYLLSSVAKREEFDRTETSDQSSFLRLFLSSDLKHASLPRGKNAYQCECLSRHDCHDLWISVAYSICGVVTCCSRCSLLTSQVYIEDGTRVVL